ncbi:type II toxin-antitoxin system HipA family toxin YjjJ [Massilia sp. CCM 8734]|uniref:type II toxin-antitoxin system HipA family toxin YjjJ n=1 Tax=Massilia sp. CCM 8734 TaxID=2609283 RepID=UPI0014210792|nr:type II toxin-antitoxin system HipA family toxin YjjJ [Massilia sp. CCM 8734]NHZ97387.1 type II toxin-antitoxin system HipA family toxin YjjJ [Massilia sp. CCM 8734]
MIYSRIYSLSAGEMVRNEHIEKLRLLLSRGPAKASAIMDALVISQSTLSRLWQSIPDGVVLGAGKTRQYALQRQVPGARAPLPLFCVSDDATVTVTGNLAPLEGGFYVLAHANARAYRLYQGIPWFLSDLRPHGFLGRFEPRRHRDLGLPDDIRTWTDEHVLQYLARRSENAAGNLILGNESYGRYVLDRSRRCESLIPRARRAELYPVMARQVMQGEPPGSSAGGEQPKFTAMVERSAGDLIEHVMVKFSPPTSTPGGRRWGDLLVCEHLALAVLARNGIAAATTSILESGDRVFLEVVRVDRVGLEGRRPMATFEAFDGELGMLDQRWTAVAHEMERMGKLTEDDVATVAILDLYGALIGNTDRHHGNIALTWTADGKRRLVEAYDMLPMLYRPTAHGEVIEQEWVPHLTARLDLHHFDACCRMALAFWEDVMVDPRISREFKMDVARLHMNALHHLAPGTATHASPQTEKGA